MTNAKAKRRRGISSLTKEERYDILKGYSEGLDVKAMATEYQLCDNKLSAFIQRQLKDMLVVRETNELMQQPAKGKPVGAAIQGSISKCLTPAFLQKVDEEADIYAYYFVQTNDNVFALKTSGLDVGIPKSMKATQKQYVYNIRGQYIRAIPAVRDFIRAEQDKLMLDKNINKVYVQRELVEQIEQLKYLSVEDPRQRSNLLKSIEMLGKTVSAFTERIELGDADAKTGLDILMERIQKEESGEDTIETYEQEGGETDNTEGT